MLYQAGLPYLNGKWFRFRWISHVVSGLFFGMLIGNSIASGDPTGPFFWAVMSNVVLFYPHSSFTEGISLIILGIATYCLAIPEIGLFGYIGFVLFSALLFKITDVIFLLPLVIVFFPDIPIQWPLFGLFVIFLIVRKSEFSAGKNRIFLLRYRWFIGPVLSAILFVFWKDPFWFALLVSSLLIILLQGKAFSFYWIPTVGVVALGKAAMAFDMFSSLIVVLISLLTLVFHVIPVYWKNSGKEVDSWFRTSVWKDATYADRRRSIEEAAKFLRASTGKENVYLWGENAILLLEGGCRHTGDGYFSHMHLAHWGKIADKESYSKDLVTRFNPELLIVASPMKEIPFDEAWAVGLGYSNVFSNQTASVFKKI